MQVAEKKQTFHTDNCFQSGNVRDLGEVNRLQRENGDQVQRIGRMENHGTEGTDPIVLPREFI